MFESKVIVVNQLGLHARAAAQLVRLAENFQSEIKLCRADNRATADAKSILDVLTLAASKGIELRVVADGADEKKASAAVAELFAGGFGEI